jgi:hypothetical protein
MLLEFGGLSGCAFIRQSVHHHGGRHLLRSKKEG